jgi:hypothetical protein
LLEIVLVLFEEEDEFDDVDIEVFDTFCLFRDTFLVPFEDFDSCFEVELPEVELLVTDLVWFTERSESIVFVIFFAKTAKLYGVFSFCSSSSSSSS